DDLDGLLVLEQIFDALAEERLVVGDEDLHSLLRGLCLSRSHCASSSNSTEPSKSRVYNGNLTICQEDAGIVKRNVAPFPTPGLSTVMRPLWLCTISREMDRPKPRRPPETPEP